jgi:hypothetical protein
MVRVGVAPCSPFSVSRELMRDAALLARDKGVMMHTHLAEDADDVRYSLEKFGCRPGEYAQDLGWTGPDVWHAHCVQLDAAEIALFARTGTGVAHCPCSNCRLGSGIAPVRAMLDAGVPLGLGVDGSASSDSGHLLAEARQACCSSACRAGRRRCLRAGRCAWPRAAGPIFSAGPIAAGSNRASAPISRSGRSTMSPPPAVGTRLPRWSWRRRRAARCLCRRPRRGPRWRPGANAAGSGLRRAGRARPADGIATMSRRHGTMHDLTGWSKGRAGEADSGPAQGLTLEQRRDPAYVPPLPMALALGVQHVLAMFVSNITPPIIVAGAAGIGFGSADPSALIYMIQAAMLFAGVATLLQTVGLARSARLPLVQGTSFAFISVMIPIVAGKGVEGMAALTTAAFLAGLLHAGLSRLVGPIRFALPPLVTGLVVLMIGLSLVRVGIEYAAGG